MKSMNEQFQPLNENMRFEALSQLREIQSNLVGVSFLPVIAIMKPTNTLKKDIIKFQDDLDSLTMEIQKFISEAKNDIDYEPVEDEPSGEEEELVKEVKDREPEDSSKPKE